MIQKLAFLLCLALMLSLVGSSSASGATLDLRIATGNDDVEEFVSDHRIDMTSSDLEFPYDGSVAAAQEQVIGLRWVVPVPKGATVTKAYLEVECDNVLLGTEPVNVIIQGQLAPNAAPFSSTAADLTGRPATKAQVAWSMANYTAVNQKIQSPDLAAIIQEIIDQPEWVAGNALVLRVGDDKSNPSKGLRESEAYDGEATAAALLHIEVSIPQATQPDPANGAGGVTSPLFGWTAGDGALAHNVYVGTTPNLTEANLVGPALAVAMYFHVPGLESGVTYYWRVDEIDATGKVAAGPVWSFTALPVTAWAPQPADAAGNLLPSQTLNWSAGQGAVQHQVFLSTSRPDVLTGAAAADKGKIAETKLATGPLAFKTTYYWRVDEIDAAAKAIKGPVWSFTTADALEMRIASGTDDGEEHLVDNPRMDITSSDLEMPYEDWSSGTSKATDEQLIGLRWKVPLAKETVVTNAYIEFILSEAKGNTAPVNVIIEGQLAPDAAAFTTAAKDISNRTRTKAQVKWTIPTGLAVGDKFQTPDLSPIIKELLSQDGWASDNAMVLMVRDDKDNPSTGIRNAESYNTASGTRAPVLRIEVATAEAPAPAALDLRITDKADDYEEHLASGEMDIDSTDLELAHEDAGEPATDEQWIGLRFTASVPRGAKIAKAYLEFEVDKVDKKGSANPVNLVIQGQLVPNAPAMTSAAKDITSRSPWTAATAKWSVPAWTKVDEKFQSSDLSAILQEIVDQDGWAGGNALLLVVRDDKDNPSTGLREAEAFEGEATAAPLLHIEVVMP